MGTITSAISQSAMALNSEGAAFALQQLRGDPLQEILRGWAFNIVVPTVTPTAAGDYFLMLQNDSNDVMVVDYIQAEAAGAESIYAEVGAAYTVGGTHATAFTTPNRLGGSPNLYSTKATVEVGVDVTGITAADSEVLRFDLAAGVPAVVDLRGRPIVIGQGQQVSFAELAGAVALTNIVLGYYHIMTPAVSS